MAGSCCSSVWWSHFSPLSTWFTSSNTDNIVNEIALHGVIAIDSDRCNIQCQNTCFKRFTCWLNQQFLTTISDGVLLLAPPTYHIQWMHALDGYVFILHDCWFFTNLWWVRRYRFKEKNWHHYISCGNHALYPLFEVRTTLLLVFYWGESEQAPH